MSTQPNRVLLIEPFYTGSHAQLIDYVVNILKENYIEHDVVTMTGKKWHWRARTSALYLSTKIAIYHNYSILFCSSVLNLCELLALRPDLCNMKKIIYFHENQFVYPIQNKLDRDFQYGYNTILSAMVADVVIFNSKYNMDTFINNIEKHLKIQPDYHLKDLRLQIAPKCQVVYFPVSVSYSHFKQMEIKKYRNNGRNEIDCPDTNKNVPLEKCPLLNDVLHIVWPHRWEHDKGPQLFFDTLFRLKKDGRNFKVSILGQSYVGPMSVFEEAKEELADHVIHFGRLDSKPDYLKCLRSADIVLSTAKHEFFGVAVLEAVLCGCFPVVPNDLVYPELYPKECLYSTPEQLYKKLRMFCDKPYLSKHYAKKINLPLELSPNELEKRYLSIFTSG